MKFLVVGEAMVDRYYYGRVSRLNPEKHSAPLLDVATCAECAGGAANVAQNLERLGADTALAKQFSGLLVKNRLLDMDEGVVARFDVGQECGPIDLKDIDRLAEDCCAVVVSDYGKGAITNEVAQHVQALDLPTFADVKVRPDRWVSWCEAMFPNAKEYATHKDDYRQARLCIVKRSEKGAVLYKNGMQSSEQFPAESCHAFNVAGAGDTVIAAYAAAYMAIGLRSDREFRESFSLRFAMKLAGAAIEQPFTTAPTPYEAYKGSIPPDVLQIVEEIARP